jgi:hypothetical protein
MLLGGAIATLFNEQCARTLFDRMEKVQAAICHRPGECDEERAAVLRNAS